MTAKRFLEFKIKEDKKLIEAYERDFNEYVASQNREYNAIIQCALTIKSLQDKLKGMQAALDAIEDFEEEE